MKTYIKNILFILLVIVVASACPLDANAQVKNDSILKNRDKAIKYAYKNLNGVGIKLNYKKAYMILKKLAEAGDAEAGNALGIMYKQGLWVKQNDKKALYLFKVASQRGYAKGAYNEALAYKFGHGTEQNPERAAKLIDLSEEMGFRKTDYAIGYAYYKGQGREQDYTKAVEHYRKGAEKGDAACMFSLGYCYLRGRGVERDIEQGKQWIEKAANKGYSRAIDFISKVDPQSFSKPRTKSASNDEIGKLIPSKMRKVKRSAEVNEPITGEWTGRIVTYDWSGEEIENESTLKVVFEHNGNSLGGFWIENDKDPVMISAAERDSLWRFDNIQLNENTRPTEMREGIFRIEQKNKTDYLVGNISFYSETTREYTRPNFVILKRDNAINSIEEQKASGISVSPNPFDDYIEIRFELQSEDKVSIKIFGMSGKQVYSENHNWQAGENTAYINTATFINGNYVMQMTGSNLNFSTIITK